MGMLIKNSIVLVDEITRLTKEGMVPYDAVINSTVNRTRPVIMASATTILACSASVRPYVFQSGSCGSCRFDSRHHNYADSAAYFLFIIFQN